MSARRTERLLNLVIALLATRRWLTKEQIRQAVPQYAENDSVEAFDRMFERDKEALRELGIPLETGTYSAWFDDELGLPHRPGRLRPAGDHLHARRAGHAGPGVARLAAGEPGRARVPRAGEAQGARCRDRLRLAGRASSRACRPTSRRSTACTRPRRTVPPVRLQLPPRRRGEPVRATVEPWKISSWHGRWYLVGHDRDREGSRVFRLSASPARCSGSGPPGRSRCPTTSMRSPCCAPWRCRPRRPHGTARVEPPRAARCCAAGAGARDHTDEVEVGRRRRGRHRRRRSRALGARAEVLVGSTCARRSSALLRERRLGPAPPADGRPRPLDDAVAGE